MMSKKKKSKKAKLKKKPIVLPVEVVVDKPTAEPEAVCTMQCTRCKDPKSKREFADVPKTNWLYCVVCHTRTTFVRDLV